jgi:DNA (cytosine-5)-methyltransferase 1
MLHLDLFSGIGGFAYAADQVFGDVEHIFCDNEPFSQAVLRKHWPEAYVYGDIKEITADSHGKGLQGENPAKSGGKPWAGERIDLVTGGFPCQPFSAAGLRRGTADDRHLWPEMLRVIRLTEPEWVIAENVGGILSWNGGLVFEQVCADLEAAGYAVQPFVIPAVAVNAPHRRDRVWFVAHAQRGADRGTPREDGSPAQEERLQEWHQVGQPGQSGSVHATDTTGDRRQRAGQVVEEKGRQSGFQQDRELARGFERSHSVATDTGRIDGNSGRRSEIRSEEQESRQPNFERGSTGWSRDWIEVATELCSVDDGLPAELDGLKLSKSQHRKEQLKAYGNAIVPQVAMQIMEAIKGGTISQ